MAGKEKSEQMSISLQPETIRLLDILAKSGFYGNKRAEVARILILDQLKTLAEKDFLPRPINSQADD
ncbi:MAG: hypothetical protein AAF830_05515 [Pseudomonadota bacterium]